MLLSDLVLPSDTERLAEKYIVHMIEYFYLNKDRLYIRLSGITAPIKSSLKFAAELIRSRKGENVNYPDYIYVEVAEESKTPQISDVNLLKLTDIMAAHYALTYTTEVLALNEEYLGEMDNASVELLMQVEDLARQVIEDEIHSYNYQRFMRLITPIEVQYPTQDELNFHFHSIADSLIKHSTFMSYNRKTNNVYGSNIEFIKRIEDEGSLFNNLVINPINTVHGFNNLKEESMAYLEKIIMMELSRINDMDYRNKKLLLYLTFTANELIMDMNIDEEAGIYTKDKILEILNEPTEID